MKRVSYLYSSFYSFFLMLSSLLYSMSYSLKMLLLSEGLIMFSILGSSHEKNTWHELGYKETGNAAISALLFIFVLIIIIIILVSMGITFSTLISDIKKFFGW